MNPKKDPARKKQERSKKEKNKERKRERPNPDLNPKSKHNPKLTERSSKFQKKKLNWVLDCTVYELRYNRAGSYGEGRKEITFL
jgi:hypothetical protein